MAAVQGASEPRLDPEPSPAAPVPSRAPPPETSESLWLRRSVIFSFWAVVVLLGLPVWWRTTAIYRAELPLQAMVDWADGKVCKPVFPLRIALQASLPPQEAHHLLSSTQHALDSLNHFSAHQLRLVLVDPPATPIANASQQVVVDDAAPAADDEDIAFTVRLIQVQTGTTPRSHLQPYSPTLDIYYSSADAPLATFVAQELHNTYAAEQAQLTHLLSSASGGYAERGHALSPETSAELQRQTTRAFKYAPTYHLTFSLFTPTSTPSSWDIDAALEQYIAPVLRSFSSISNFTIDTQVQLYATFSPSIREPEYDESLRAWTLRKEDLSGFINAAEWPLSPSIGQGPTIHFALYVPDRAQSPLLVQGSGANSWLVPQWGGVAISNHLHEATPASLSKTHLLPAMQVFSDQLIALLGLPQAPASLPLRLSTLTRVRTTSLIFSASSTLGALAQVYQKMPSIPVPDSVAKSVEFALEHLQSACDSLRDGHFELALEHARLADGEAEKAFFERSMVGQVYFPDEHKVAVYLPLLGPVAVPLVMAALKEIKAAVAARRSR